MSRTGGPNGSTAVLVERLVERAGRTYAEAAGIKLSDRPAPLYQLLVLATVLAKPISADLGVAAAAELRKAGFTTAAHMRASTWQSRVDALGRAHYRRYDESTATLLGESAELLDRHHRGDLRRVADEAKRDVDSMTARLEELPGCGPVAAGIFLREVQAVWPWVRPYVDDRMLQGAASVGLPADRGRLTRLVAGSASERLAAALVRVSLDDALAEEIRQG